MIGKDALRSIGTRQFLLQDWLDRADYWASSAWKWRLVGSPDIALMAQRDATWAAYQAIETRG
jgi:hypothetical protein